MVRAQKVVRREKWQVVGVKKSGRDACLRRTGVRQEMNSIRMVLAAVLGIVC